MSFLRKYASLFLKTKVINYGYHVERSLVELVKNGLETPEESFQDVDAGKFYECRFYSYLGQHFRPSMDFMTEGEAAKYDESIKLFQQFEELNEFFQKLARLHEESRCLYLDISRQISTHNLWNRAEENTETQYHDIERLLDSYRDALKQLEDYPLWQEKVREEVGYHIHLIYNIFNHNEEFKEIFQKFVNYIIYIILIKDNQYFFK